jgi:carbamoyltransferase
MIICGLKLTHDGAVALLDGDRLIFSTEMEKLANSPRYSPVADLRAVPRLLADFGYRPEDVDEWVIDGWDGDKQGRVETTDDGHQVELTVGPYHESEAFPDLAKPAHTGEFGMAGHAVRYTSYSHAAGHVISAYCSSPFAERGEPSFVLVWDGGMFPQLYWCDPEHGVANGGSLFPLIGHTYATAAHHFGPFRRPVQSANVDDLGVAGKLMAYIALGRVREPIGHTLRTVFDELLDGDSPAAVKYRSTVRGYGSLFEPSMPPLHAFFAEVRERLAPARFDDEDVLTSVHWFLQELLTERLTARIREWRGDGPWNLCFAGGCALNIKWNSALRASPIVDSMWVPPFPNDSGSAIGATALARIQHVGMRAVSWQPRLGPALGPAPTAHPDWTSEPCSPERLGELLHETGAPVVVLNGRAELGPRALGGRSILAAATDPAMKDLLNDVKERAWYRPVAPVCLVEHAPDVFDPGTPDPYMLFDHDVRREWRDRIPAVVHLDGTARLQTVADGDDPLLRRVLTSYHRISGTPLLCNTSANHSGRGFFPDVSSAMAWGRVDLIWSEEILYRRER